MSRHGRMLHLCTFAPYSARMPQRRALERHVSSDRPRSVVLRCDHCEVTWRTTSDTPCWLCDRDGERLGLVALAAELPNIGNFGSGAVYRRIRRAALLDTECAIPFLLGGVLIGRDRAAFQHDLVGADGLHVSESNDVLDRAQELDLGDRQRRTVVHGGRDLLVEADQLVAGFEPGEQVVDAVGLCRCLDSARHAVDGVGHELEGLEIRAVPHPRVAGPHPPDAVGVDTMLEQYSIGEVMSRTVEFSEIGSRPLVKVYSAKRLRRMFGRFESISVQKRQMVPGEVPRVLRRVPARWIARFAGWNLIIKAHKPRHVTSH